MCQDQDYFLWADLYFQRAQECNAAARLYLLKCDEDAAEEFMERAEYYYDSYNDACEAIALEY